jgi:hypothetical protein
MTTRLEKIRNAVIEGDVETVKREVQELMKERFSCQRSWWPRMP